MKLYRVCGECIVSVYKEIWANNEDEAYIIAERELDSLTEYIGNGGDDKIVGVGKDNESVAADSYIEWNDIEELKNDPGYRECVDCHEKLEEYEGDNGEKFWKCEGCGACYDENGDEINLNDYFDKGEN